MVKKLIFVFTCVLVIISVIGGIIFFIIPSSPERSSKENLISFFNQNRDIFVRIVQYLNNIDGDVEIDKRRGNDLEAMTEIVTKDGRKPFIINKEIRRDIETLLDRHEFMGISEDVNYIFFYKALGFQWYQAIIYSKDGAKPPLNRTREYEEIEGNWYYYCGE